MARGSIRAVKTAKGTSYYIRVPLGLDPQTGKRLQGHDVRYTRREAETRLRQWLHEIDMGHAQVPDITVGELLKRWLNDEARLSVRPSTFSQYVYIVNKHLLPEWGGVKLAKLRPDAVQAFYAGLVDAGIQPPTVRKVHALLSRALRMALRLGYIHTLPTEHAVLPRQPKNPLDLWTSDELDRFLSVLETSPLRLVFFLALATGMRRAEVLGLRWADVDLERGRLMINWTYTMVGTKPAMVPEAKNTKSSRPVDLAPSVVALLHQHRAAQDKQRAFAGTDWHEGDMVLCDAFGKPYHPIRVNKEMAKLIKRAGVRPMPPKSMRHWHISHLLASGIPVLEVAKRVGHANSHMTLNTYGHVITEDRTAEAVESALFSRGN